MREITGNFWKWKPGAEITVVVWNVDGISTVISGELKQFLSQFHIICLVETKMPEGAKIKMSGYVSYQNNRDNQGGG